jgi:hypothetical protein
MPEDQSGQVTELLQQWTRGDEQALRALVPLVYKELRRLAHYHLQAEREVAVGKVRDRNVFLAAIIAAGEFFLLPHLSGGFHGGCGRLAEEPH